MASHPSTPRVPDGYPHRMAGRPRWQRVLIPLLLLAAVLVVPVVLGSQALRAERVAIRVDSCDLSGPKATQDCRGSWRLADGRTVTGPVDGGPLSPGRQVSGWGNPTRATTSLLSWLMAPLLVGAALLGALGILLVVWLRLNRQARRP